MSRSRKLAIEKDKPMYNYNRRFRRVNRQRVHEGKRPIPMRTLVNCYDVCDYKIDLEHCGHTLRYGCFINKVLQKELYQRK